MEFNPLLKMTIPERLDTFLLDTFQTHTRHDRTISFQDVYEYYLQWCEAMDVPPLGNNTQVGAALRKRFFCVNRGNYRYWFIEIKEDLINEEIEDEFRELGTGGSGSDRARSSVD